MQSIFVAHPSQLRPLSHVYAIRATCRVLYMFSVPIKLGWPNVMKSESPDIALKVLFFVLVQVALSSYSKHSKLSLRGVGTS